MRVEFMITEEKGELLMSKETAQVLGIFHIGLGVNSVTSEADLNSEFERVFRGVGKLQGSQFKLIIDSEVKPVAQPVRRTPFGLWSKVEAKIQ